MTPVQDVELYPAWLSPFSFLPLRQPASFSAVKDQFAEMRSLEAEKAEHFKFEKVGKKVFHPYTTYIKMIYAVKQSLSFPLSLEGWYRNITEGWRKRNGATVTLLSSPFCR